MKRKLCGKHPYHRYVQGLCLRCGRLSKWGRKHNVRRSIHRDRPASALAKIRQDQYLAALDRFADFCGGAGVAFKDGIVEAMHRYMTRTNHGRK